MIDFTPVSIDIFGFSVYYYGIILMTGVVAASYLANIEAKRRGLDQDFLWDSLVWIVIGGVVGARIWHVLTPPPSMVERGLTTAYYLTHPLDAINPRLGGLGIPGAVIGGILGLYFFSRKHKQPLIVWLDVLAPAIPLGQAIGRWGNYVNQELYGAPSNLPWAIEIDLLHRLPQYANVSHYHPIFLYESLWNFGSVFLLLWIARKFKDQLIPGDLFLAYLITYPLIRFLLDFIRLDASQVAGFNANQTVMIVVLIAASFILYWRHRANK